MKTWLVRFGLWLARRGGWSLPVCSRVHVPASEFLDSARELVAWAEATYPGTSGEHKRHQVYARLLRRHATASPRTLALAIEMALQ